MPLFSWLIFSLKESIYRKLSRVILLKSNQLSQAVSKRSDMLIKALKEIDYADLVIGHNPGAMYPSLVAANKFNCPVGFDVEDYHPGEGNDNNLRSLNLKLFESNIKKFSYISIASELIKNRLEEDLQIRSNNWFTVMNYFPSTEFIEPSNNYIERVKFVWFSQNINFGRGLESFLELFKDLYNCELHLYGNPDKEFTSQVLSKYKNIIIHNTVSHAKLHYELSNYDIGLALDIAIDKNRDIAITNKLLAYLQAGLYVISSDTSAHKYILSKYDLNGVCMSSSIINNSTILKEIINNIKQIRNDKLTRYNLFKKYCWETEQVGLKNKWAYLLSESD